MTVTPSGVYGLMLENARILLATCATFQTAVGATGDAAAKLAAAKAKVYFDGVELPTSNTFPFAMLKLGDDVQHVGSDTGGGGFYPSGSVIVHLEIAMTTGESDEDRLMRTTNYAGAIASEMMTLAKTAGYLLVTRVSLAAVQLSGKKEKDKYQAAELILGVLQ